MFLLLEGPRRDKTVETSFLNPPRKCKNKEKNPNNRSTTASQKQRNKFSRFQRKNNPHTSIKTETPISASHRECAEELYRRLTKTYVMEAAIPPQETLPTDFQSRMPRGILLVTELVARRFSGSGCVELL